MHAKADASTEAKSGWPESLTEKES